jgi:hypothetical protein
MSRNLPSFMPDDQKEEKKDQFSEIVFKKLKPRPKQY